MDDQTLIVITLKANIHGKFNQNLSPKSLLPSTLDGTTNQEYTAGIKQKFGRHQIGCMGFTGQTFHHLYERCVSSLLVFSYAQVSVNKIVNINGNIYLFSI